MNGNSKQSQSRPAPCLQTAFVFVVLLTAAMAPLVTASPTYAAESSSPSDPSDLFLASLGLNVEVTDALAVTHLNASYENPKNRSHEVQVELPMSPTAVVTGFRLTVHNETFVGVVKGKQEAQEDYNDSVERDEHAVLLTSAGNGRLAFQVNIPANSTATVEADFVEILPLLHGTQTYTFPLDRLGGSYGQIQDLRVDLTATTNGGWDESSASGLPFEEIATSNDTVAYHYQAQNVTPAQEIRFQLTPHAEGYGSGGIVSGHEQDASAVFTILPPGSGGDPIAKDVVLIMDVSGSMSGDKIEQAQDALTEILDQLRPDDRFVLISFSSQLEVQHTTLQHPTEAALQDAKNWVDTLAASGSTNISGALDEGLQIHSHEGEALERLASVVLVTDGQPTAGITNPAGIIDATAGWNTMGARIHTVGIGFGHDNAFLNELAGENQGHYQGMPRDADASEVLADFMLRLGTPLLKDVTVTLPELNARDAHPRPLPDLYEGSQLVYAARVDASDLSGEQEVRIQGQSANGPETIVVTMDSDDIHVVPEAEQLWARQKAITLEHRLELDPYGEDADHYRQELRTLGVEHQIATTETSWIVVASEPGILDALPDEPNDIPADDDPTLAYHNSGGGGDSSAMDDAMTDADGAERAYHADDVEHSGEEEPTPAPAIAALLVVLGLFGALLRRRRTR